MAEFPRSAMAFCAIKPWPDATQMVRASSSAVRAAPTLKWEDAIGFSMRLTGTGAGERCEFAALILWAAFSALCGSVPE